MMAACMRIMVMLLQGQSCHSCTLYGWEVIRFQNGTRWMRSPRWARCASCAYLATQLWEDQRTRRALR